MCTHIFWGVLAVTVVGGVCCGAMTLVAWRERERPAVTAFGWLMAVCTVWAAGSVARMLAADPGTVALFDLIVRAASSSVAPLILVFVLSYTGRERYLTRRSVALLWTVPTGYVALSATAPFHGLGAGLAGVERVTRNGVSMLVVPEGLPSEVDLLYTYVLLAVSLLLLTQFLVQSRAIYRPQTTLVTTGILVPVMVNAATQFYDLSHPGIDLTPAALGLTGLVLGWGLFRYRLLEVTPLASDMLVDELPDPVFVLDEHQQVLDHNRVAATAFDESDLCGRDLQDIAPGLTDTVEGSAVYSRAEGEDDEMTYYDPKIRTIEDQHGRERGRLVVLRDVTGQQRRQDRLEALQAATQQFITAGSADRIAELTVTFADRVLDQDATCVYIHDDDEARLRGAAVSDVLAVTGHDGWTLDDPDHPVYEVYEAGEPAVVENTDRGSAIPFPHLLLVPIGDHGVLSIGSEEPGAFGTEDEQFATILARTTQVALSQIERERELRQSRQAIERRTEQMEFFNGVLRHTLRNALLVIEGRADHLREHVDGNRERHLDRITQWCADLSELSEEIQAINDTVTASEARRLDRIDLGSRLREQVDRLSAEFEHATIETSIEDDLTVRANDLVEKVIDSVVSNAVTHNDASDPRVEITAATVADRVQVRVADNGPGMSDEMKETIFERNVGTSQTSHGFGLYFVSVMMNLYGGTVWIEDNEDGATGDRCGAVAVLEFQQAEPQRTSQSAENEAT